MPFTAAKGHYVTRGSREIPHRSTNLAQCRLASGIGRDLAFSAWYERSMSASAYQIYINSAWACDTPIRFVRIFLSSGIVIVGPPIGHGTSQVSHMTQDLEDLLASLV